MKDIGGRGSIGIVTSHDFASDDEDTEILCQKVKTAYEYLSEILGIEDEEE
jgi:hypothetical protein